LNRQTAPGFLPANVPPLDSRSQQSGNRLHMCVS
jgi:hypothetical protein